ncbi:toll-like receptor 9 [Denticeps clupeoides]|nr:toll-like receptor 9 [Denticeps clupeoides]
MLPVSRAILPRFFPCDNDTSLFSVDCTGRDLIKIPPIRAQSVLSLNLNNNQIKWVQNGALDGVPNLRNFSLMWNCPPGRYQSLGTPSCRLQIEDQALASIKDLKVLFLTGNSLTSVPPLPEGLEILDLQYNNLFHFNKPLGTPVLQQLLLSKNCFHLNPCNQSFFIHPKVFRGLPQLKNLTLGFNNVTSVPEGLPLSLESLDLKENKIQRIEKDAFVNLNSLRFLNLEWNCQRCDHAAQPCFPCPNNEPLQLDSRAFHSQAGSLTQLSLRGNSICTFPPGLFAPLLRLESLDLSDNLLANAIRNETFYQELKSVKVLNLVYNYKPHKTFRELVLSPFFVNMSALEALYLGGYFFHSLSDKSLDMLRKLPRLEFLDLRSNFISSCNMSAFRGFRALRRVILAQNLLDFLPSCSARNQEWQPQHPNHATDRAHGDESHCQDCSSSTNKPLLGGMQKTERGSSQTPSTMRDFYRQLCQQKLYFDMSYNNILTLNASVFEGMEEVECLDLSFNYMSLSPNGKQFKPLRSLVYLNLAHNRINMYFDEAFKELQGTLRALDLSNNEFHFMMVGMGHRFTFLSNLTALEALSLANNQIKYRITNNLTSSSLRFLSFSGNYLNVMWDMSDQYVHFFQGLTNLTHLDISYNNLKSFSPDVLVNLPLSLQHLRMDNNMLNYFPWANITALPRLCYLNLSKNSLSKLPDFVVGFGRDFEGLDLSHNQISSLPKDFFSQMAELRTLLLNNNQLKLLEAQSLPAPLHVGSMLRTLTLHSNPFACSCLTSWFADYLRQTAITIPQLTTAVRCGFPESQEGVSVLSVDPRSCQEIFGGVAFLCTLLLTVTLTAIPLLQSLYGWDLWYCVQVLWAGHKGYSHLQGSLGAHAEYDAFVVFDTADQAVGDWIYHELVASLESQGRRTFRLCLEERDWVPGFSCIENLHAAVNNSRKTVFVLANRGQVSGVVRQAFLLVQQRLLDEKVDVAVLVLLDPLFPKLKYLKMRKRLCRKSVLSWPSNPRAQPLFWNKLRTALASDNVRSYDQKIAESFMSD